jgi:hypothetical protein
VNPATSALAAAWLRRVVRSRYADRLILRGSLLTRQWVPGRPAADVDHVIVPSSTLEEAKQIVDDVLALPDETPLPPATTEIIWAETPWPGVRVHVGDGELQIDVGFGDPLAVPPSKISVLGVDLLAVRPETMFAWKIHGLVELGHGKWRPKDLWDAFLLDTNVALDEPAVRASLRLAFASRGVGFDLLDRFLHTTEWGRSRGSRRKWDTFRKRYAGPHAIPDLLTVRDHVRVRLRPLVA